MDEVSVDIDAPRQQVWELVADFDNMRRWSPELRRIIWLGAKGPAVGARFVGINRHGAVPWPTLSKVTRLDEERCVEWEVSTSSMRWGYRFEDTADGGTRVTEYREPFKKQNPVISGIANSGVIGRDRDALLLEGMRTTLARVKAAAESA